MGLRMRALGLSFEKPVQEAYHDTHPRVVALNAGRPVEMCVRSNESILAATHYRIAAAVALNPAFAFAGSSDDDTHALVLDSCSSDEWSLVPIGSRVVAGMAAARLRRVSHSYRSH